MREKVIHLTTVGSTILRQESVGWTIHMSQYRLSSPCIHKDKPGLYNVKKKYFFLVFYRFMHIYISNYLVLFSETLFCACANITLNETSNLYEKGCL